LINSRHIKIKLSLKRKLEGAIYLFTGVFAFSSLSSYLIIDKLNLPFYLPELLLFPLLIFKSKVIFFYLKRLLTNLKSLIKLIFSLNIIGFLILLAHLNYPNSIGSIISTSRPIIYIILIAFGFSIPKNINFKFMFYLVIGIFIGDFINVLFISNIPYQAVNIIGLFLFISLPIIYKKNILQIITISSSTILILNAGFRILILTVVISFVFSHFFMIIKASNRPYVLAKKVFIKIIIFLIIFFLSSYLVNFYIQNFDLDRFTYFRIYDRTVNLFTGGIEKSQDISRFKKITWIWTKFYENIIPKGFIMEASGNIGNYNDIPIIWFYVTIGSFTSLFFLPWLLWKGFNFLIYKLKTSDNVDTSLAIAVFLIGSLLLLNGRFLYITYESWLFGIILGRWFSRESFLIKNKF